KENMNIESTVDRWDLVFQRAEKQGFPLDTLTPIVCNILVLSPSNAANESMFSLLNYYLPKSKSRSNFSTMYSHFMCHSNIPMELSDFRELLINSPDMLEEIASGNKSRHLKQI